MAAKVLSESGLKVAVVEAGPFFDPANDAQRTQLRNPWDSPRRGAGSTRAFGDYDAAYGGWEIDGEPYTRKNGTRFDWFRSRMLGGRTNHWGRISLRFGPLDFKRKDVDGLGDNWPIGYEDVRPYYDRVDKLLGVFGSKEGIHNEPDGFFLPPPKPRLHELYYIKGARKANIPVIPSRLSILTIVQNSRFEFIANSFDSFYVPVPNFGSKFTDVDIDGAVTNNHVIPPNRRQNGVAGKDLSRLRPQ